MKTVIIVHVLPQEIDWFEWQCKQLHTGRHYLSSTDTIVFDITLNFNLVEWGFSSMQRDFFISKLNKCVHLLEWNKNISICTRFNSDILGIDDARRNAIRLYNNQTDNFIYLDPDLIFRPETLAYLIEAARNIKEDYYIISPQLTKLWDSTWDVLCSEDYSFEEYGFERTQDPFDILNDISGIMFGPTLLPIPVFKFGGGWFNMISAKLLWKTDIPDSFGPYGIDDTYVMHCCELMKQKGISVQQYVLENLIVAENYKFRDNPYEDYLQIIDRKSQYRNIAETNMGLELRKFASTI